MVNFHQAMFQANLLYGVEMLPQDFEEWFNSLELNRKQKCKII